MKGFIWWIEDQVWGLRCSYNFWLHGPYGLSKVIEKLPFPFMIKYLQMYGATIGENCVFERGINIHRPGKRLPFENIVIGNGVYLGHSVILDLSERITIENNVAIGGRSQIWTHAGFYREKDPKNPDYTENTNSVIIGECAIIYSNVIITHGVQIGKFAKIGASSLVNKSIPDNEFWGGVPVKFISSSIYKITTDRLTF